MKTLSFTTDCLSGQESTLKQIVEDVLSSSNQQHDQFSSEWSDYYIDYGDHGYADYIDTNYEDYHDYNDNN